MEFTPVQYRYRKAHSCIQIMSYGDIMRMYGLMININSWREGIRLWSIIYEHVNDKIFDDFSEFNEAIIAAVYEYKENPNKPLRTQQQQQPQPTPIAGSKRGRSSPDPTTTTTTTATTPLHEHFAKKACIR